MDKTEKILSHLDKLGHRVRDKVTKIEGVLVSVSFDLFGCIQAVVNRGIDKDGKKIDGEWFDIDRLEVISEEKVMPTPNYLEGAIAEGKKGPAEKPSGYRL